MSVGDVYPYQIKPDWLYGILQPQFQARAEPNFAWKSCVSALLALPALRAAWPMSSVGYQATDHCRDVSGAGNHLTNTSLNVQFAYDNLAPYASFVSAGSDYLVRLDGGASNWADILGTETFVPSAQRGLTLGGWFQFTAAAGSREAMIGKWDAGANERSYIITREAGGDLRFYVSDDGTAGFESVDETSVAVPALNTWFFTAGRFDPGNSLIKIWHNNASTEAATTFAALHNGAADFTIGRYSDNQNLLDGRASLCFLCAAQLSDSIVAQIYHQTRSLFGV